MSGISSKAKKGTKKNKRSDEDEETEPTAKHHRLAIRDEEEEEASLSPIPPASPSDLTPGGPQEDSAASDPVVQPARTAFLAEFLETMKNLDPGQKELMRGIMFPEVHQTSDSSGKAVLQNTMQFQSLDELTVTRVLEYQKYAEAVDTTSGSVDRSQMPEDVRDEIDLLWQGSARVGDWKKHSDISTRDLCQWLVKNLQTTDGLMGPGTKTLGHLIKWLKAHKLPFNVRDIQPLMKHISAFKVELRDLIQQLGVSDLPKKDHRELIKECSTQKNVKISGCSDPNEAFHALFTGDFLHSQSPPQQIIPWLESLFNFNMKIKDQVRHVESYLGKPGKQTNPNPNTDKTPPGLIKKKGDKGTATPAAGKKKTTSTLAFRDDQTPDHGCTYCGKPKAWHEQKNGVNNIVNCCIWANGHHNKENVPWKNSTVGKEYIALGYKHLPYEATSKRFVEKIKGELHDESSTCCVLCNNNNTINIPHIKSNLIEVRLTIPNSSEFREVKVLLDTGARKDYMSETTAEWLTSRGIIKQVGNVNICSAFTGVCQPAKHSINYNISLLNEFKTITTIGNRATIIDSDIDLILGRDTIVEEYMIMQYPSQFMKGDFIQKLLSDFPYRVGQDDQGTTSLYPLIEKVQDRLTDLVSYANNFDTDNEVHKPCTCSDCVARLEQHRTSNMSTIAPYLREDLYGIDDDQLESIPSEFLSDHDEKHQILPCNIRGPQSLQDSISDMLERYHSRFSTEVRAEPAKLPPFDLRVDKAAWELAQNSLPARRADQTRQAEINKITSTLKDHNIITPSREPYYSHAFVVPKPNGKWRFVVDYKNLNLITEMERWPIPNIKEMLFRLGDKKPKYYAVFDLTSGYYQAPISANSRKWTAFMTWNGVYEWKRLPMGLKGAPSYFQRVMSTHVLGGLINVICELYLDDLIIYGSTEEEFLANLEAVFKRLEEYEITLNPTKCIIGSSSVEYVGHTINNKGLHFKREKLDGVINFPLPTKFKHLKSFLGLANYFREHVRDHSRIVKPLNDLILGYAKTTKNKPISWTSETSTAFAQIRDAIHECPMIFFMDDTSPIYLETDASDYGIGAYLYQVIDGTHHPIAFISKTLHGAELKWDTAQKEGYAIFYALKKWEYLLRDRFFTLKTDHDNLVKLKSMYKSEKKVQRWLTCFQEYDYHLEHIKGTLNEVADTLSRLCEIESIPVADRICFLEEFRVPQKYWKHISRVHHSNTGHRGVEATMDKLKELIDKQEITLTEEGWPNMREHIKRFIRRCPCCQKMSQLKSSIKANPFTMSTYEVMERLAVDFIERLTPDEDGNDHILVIIDTFSRFVELVPCKGATAKNAAKALFAHMGRYGSFAQLLSDRGSAFISGVFKELLLFAGTEHLTSTPYSKEENSIVERSNKEVMRHLRNIIFDWRVAKKWSTYLPIVQRVMNSTKHTATGVPPSEIVFGLSIFLDRGIFWDPTADQQNIGPRRKSQKLSAWMSSAMKVQTEIIAIAEKHLRARDEQHMSSHSTIHREDFLVDSYVLAEHRSNSLRRGPSSKLLPFLKGPMRIVNVVDDTYTLQDLVTMRNRDYHVSKLRPFLFDPLTENPLDYAIRDDNSTYVVDKITSLKGKPLGPKKLLWLKVYWVGEKDSSWEPWSRMRNSSALQTYLKDHTNATYRALCPQNITVEQEGDWSDIEEHSDEEFNNIDDI